jgi:glycosyltransferase involved in cell wall biosynthesis
MLAVQSPHHGHRGIGRYSANLVSTLLERDDGHEYVLYVHDGLPADRVPTSTRAEVRTIRPRWELGETLSPCLDRLARTNPDRLDALVVLSPFERWALYTPPAPPRRGLKVASVVYDLIPFLFQNEWGADPVLMRHYRVLEMLRRYDLLLAISASTRDDCLSVLRLPPDRVVNISGASDPSYFTPDPARDAPPTESTRRVLEALGIVRPFVLNVGGLDERKNTGRLIDAFACLPARLRRSHQLVLTFQIGENERGAVLAHAERLGLGGTVVVTREVPDDTLRLLYQRCEAFALPSSYEGFGLPLLEAMHCGAPVVAGNNSSQVEVVGDAGLLVDVGDAQDIAVKIARLLDDGDLRASLRARALEQSRRFRWGATADAALEGLDRTVRGNPARRLRFDPGHGRKPRIAFFSPLPPRKSGISDYSAFLLDELKQTYQVDLFHDSGYIPEPALTSPEFACFDHVMFARVAASRDYHAVVYQMGNSRYHSYMVPTLLRHPGLVTLHDFCLAGFHLHYGHARGQGLGFLRDELLRWYPESRDEIVEAVAGWPSNWEEIARDCVRRGWYLNRHVIDAAQALVVHSPWCRERVGENSPWYAGKVRVIPHGIHPRRATDERRAAIRARYGLPHDALIVASFGFVHPDKMNPQALDAFAAVGRDDPSALYVFVGEDADGGEVRRHAAALGLNDRVRFLGRQPAEAFIELMAVTDVGVNLRLPPTNGETSGALLNLLASGVATVVTDVATFADYPDHVVRKVRWETEGPDGLLRAMSGLATDRAAREALGRRAWDYVDEHHEWSRVAKRYVEAIEECHDSLAESRPRARGHAPAARAVGPGTPASLAE